MAQNIVDKLVGLSQSGSSQPLSGSGAGQINLGKVMTNVSNQLGNQAISAVGNAFGSGYSGSSRMKVNSLKYSGSTMQQSTSAMSKQDDLKCMMTGSCAGPTALSGSGALFSSTSRRGNNDMSNTGIVPFSVIPQKSVVSAGDGELFNGIKTQNIQDPSQCTDCSAVGEDEFMAKCVVDSNLSSALLKFSGCMTGANRRIDQDAGSRQINSVSQRDNTQYNLTNPANVDSSEGPASGSSAAYGSSALFASRDPAGDLQSADGQYNVGKIGSL
jgi:hypothetical protein